MDYVIGVDIGTQSTKALLVDARGRIAVQHTQGYQPDTPRPLWAEQWPDVWLEAVLSCIAGCVQASGIAAGAVKALCISGLYGGSGIPVDADLKPLHPCLIWMDRRSEAEVAWVRANLDQARVQAITGNGVDSYYGFTKMLWLRNNRPEVWNGTRCLLPPNAYVIAAMTGEVAVDHSSAGNIGGIYDIARRQWSAELLEALGIPAAMMPGRLVASDAPVGALLPDWAARLGLLTGTPVIAGGVDAPVATFAAGATRPGKHVAMIGTSMCWGTVAHEADARHGLVAMPHVFNSERDLYVFGGATTAGASVTWFQDVFGETGGALRQLDVAAAAVPEGADGVVFLPYLMGERSPVWDGRASGAFVGLNLFHGRAHLFRAVLEGVTFALRHNMEAGLRGIGTLDPQLIVVGGAARSDLWMQIVADVTGHPVMTIEEDVEAALGAALLAALGVGLASPEDAEKGWVTLKPRAEPRAAARSAYDRVFEVYAGLYPALRDSMHQLYSIR
jgi:ribulokinase